jgi:hypothetical protein
MYQGVWCVVCVVCGAWCVVRGAWCVVRGAWCVVCGVWCVVCVRPLNRTGVIRFHRAMKLAKNRLE